MSVMSHEIRNFAFVMDAVVKIFLSLLLLWSSSSLGLTASDSTLIERVAALSGKLQQGRYDDVLAEAGKLLPEAMAQRDIVAQGTLRNVLGTCRMHKGEYLLALREYTICADLCEKGDFLHIARNNEPKNHVMFRLYIPMYAELVALNQKYGNIVEALHNAQTGLRWLSACNDNLLRASMTGQMAEPLIENKNYRLVYPLLEQSFVDATNLELYDFALRLCTQLIICEEKEYHRKPEDYDWIRAGDMLMSLAKLEDVKRSYASIRAEVMVGNNMSEKDVASSASRDTVALVSTMQEDAVSADTAVGSADIAADSIDQGPVGQSLPVAGHQTSGQLKILDPWFLMLIAAMLFVTCVYLFLIRQRYRRRRDEDHRKSYIEGQENERTRLAKELHDSVANQLLAVEMKLSTDGLTQQAMELLNESREQVRHVSHELLTPEFTHHTIDDILTQYVAQIDGVRKCMVTYTSTPDNADWSFVPKEKAMEIYRIVQEAVGNALKHSEASIVSIGLHLDEKQNLMMIVSDNGIGQDSKDETADGIGIRTMRQRAEVIDGRIEFYRHQYGNVGATDKPCGEMVYGC